MCQSRADGGQRCFGHAKKKFDKAFAKLINAERDHGVGTPKHTAALDKATVSGAHLASTPDGLYMMQVKAAAAANLGNTGRAGWYDSMARQGQVLRASNEAVRRAHSTDQSVQQNVAHRANLEAIGSSPAQAGDYAA